LNIFSNINGFFTLERKLINPYKKENPLPSKEGKMIGPFFSTSYVLYRQVEMTLPLNNIKIFLFFFSNAANFEFKAFFIIN
jgi:hypothetical protein